MNSFLVFSRTCFFATVVLLAIARSDSLHAGITDDKIFLADLKTALADKNKAKLDQLTYTEGMSEVDKVQMAKAREHILAIQEIESLEFEPLDKPFRPFYIMQGRRVEPTAQPSGMIRIKFKSPNAQNSSLALAYTVVDGSYWLVSSKSTDLKWTGPADVNIGFMVMGPGQDKVRIKAKYNASGVDLEQEFDSPSTTLWGQHFTEIIVTSEDPATNVVLTVRENNQEIHKSEPLQGVGQLSYTKPK